MFTHQESVRLRLSEIKYKLNSVRGLALGPDKQRAGL